MEKNKQTNCYVFLPVFNGDKYITDTINSVLVQDYDKYHLIIVDDCSSDKSKEIINSFKSRYPQKITTIFHSRNMGVGRTLHELSKNYCDVDYIAQIGQDDIWPNSYLSSQISKLIESKARVTFSAVDYIDSSTLPNMHFHPVFRNEKLMTLSSSEDLFCSLLQGNYLCASSSVISLEGINEKLYTYWGVDNNLLQDYEMWLNLSLLGLFIYNNAVTIHYRIHDNNLSNTQTYISNNAYDYVMLFERLFISGNLASFFYASNDKSHLARKIISALNLSAGDTNSISFLKGIISNFFVTVGINDSTVLKALNQYYKNEGLLRHQLQQSGDISPKITIFFEDKKLSMLLSQKILLFATPIFNTSKIQGDTLFIIANESPISDKHDQRMSYPYPLSKTLFINTALKTIMFRNIEYPIANLENVLLMAYETLNNHFSINKSILSDTYFAIEYDVHSERLLIDNKPISHVLIKKYKRQNKIISVISVSEPIESQSYIYIQGSEECFIACDAFILGSKYIMLFKNSKTADDLTGERVYQFANQVVNQYYHQEILFQKELKTLAKKIIKGINSLTKRLNRKSKH